MYSSAVLVRTWIHRASSSRSTITAWTKASSFRMHSSSIGSSSLSSRSLMRKHHTSWVPPLCMTAMAGLTAVVVAVCEEEEEESETMEPSSSTATTTTVVVSADPYDNLPEEDEPTQCSICKVNRQGPCRPSWRKFERCMKDHSTKPTNDSNNNNINDDDDDDDDDSFSSNIGDKCDKYTMEWMTCMSQHREVYMLLANEVTQEEWIDPLECEIIESAKRHEYLTTKGGITGLKEQERIKRMKQNQSTTTTSPPPAVEVLSWNIHHDANSSSSSSTATIDWSDVWDFAQEQNFTLNDFAATPSLDWKSFLNDPHYINNKKRLGRELHDYVAAENNSLKYSREQLMILGTTTTSSSSSSSLKAKPILEMTDQELQLVEVRARIDMTDTSTSTKNDTDAHLFKLDVCYARDQTGRLLGMEQVKHEDDDAAVAQNENGNDDDDDDSMTTPTTTTTTIIPGPKEFMLRFHIQPGLTQCVKLYKIYRGPQGQIRLYSSKPKFVVEAAHEAGLE